MIAREKSLSKIMRSPTEWMENKINKLQAQEDAEAIQRASDRRLYVRVRNDVRNEVGNGQLNDSPSDGPDTMRDEDEPKLPSWASRVLGGVNGQGRLGPILLNRGSQ